MKTITGLVCLSLCLTLLSPAFCGPPSALLGKWQSPVYAPGRSFIFQFKPDGTEAVLLRRGTTVSPVTNKKGKTEILRYIVSGNKLRIIYPNHKWDEYRFKVRGDKLICTKVLVFQSRPNRGDLRGGTLTRYKG
jgi:hypothetical protein